MPNQQDQETNNPQRNTDRSKESQEFRTKPRDPRDEEEKNREERNKKRDQEQR